MSSIRKKQRELERNEYVHITLALRLFSEHLKASGNLYPPWAAAYVQEQNAYYIGNRDIEALIERIEAATPAQ